jgi:hypothetical protein
MRAASPFSCVFELMGFMSGGKPAKQGQKATNESISGISTNGTALPIEYWMNYSENLIAI